MKMILARTFFVLLVLQTESLNVGVNPIRKIVSMLQDMQKELVKEQDSEKELFEKAMCACETGQKDLQTVIDQSTASITDLTASLEEESAQKSATDEELKNHYAGKQQAEDDLAKATALRTKESTQFSKESGITKGHIEQLSGAIPQLEGGASAASLMQQDDSPKLRRVIEVTRYLSPEKRETVLNFLDDGLGESTGQPTAGTSQIIGILKDMKDHMTSDLSTMTADEKSAAQGFADLKAAKQQEITSASEAIIAKEKRSGAMALSISQSDAALDDAKDELADAQAYLSTLNEACDKKRKERDMRNKMRHDEIAAISEAIAILNEDDSLDVFKKAVPSAALLSEKRQTADFDAFVQVDGLASRKASFQKAAGLVAKLAKTHPSAQYHLLLSQLKAAEEPEGTEKYAGAAAKVVTHMVDDMVHVLHDEDVEDEHKKDFCANETERTINLQTEKQNLVESLKASISEMNDEVSELENEIKTLEEEIHDNDKEVFEASELRQKEHKEFQDTFSTMDTARRLLDKAATRLHKFYHPEMHGKKVKAVQDKALSDAGLSLAVKKMKASFDTVDESFAQKKVVLRHHARKVAPPVLPETPGTYEKKESGGVLGLMNKMKEELTADMREAETEEKFAAKDYVRIMKEAKETRAQLVKTKTHKEAAKAETTSKIVDAKSLQSLTLEELQNLALYMAQLHSECDFLMRNYEVRHDGRVNEETGLEDAKTIVTNEEPPSHTVVEQGYKDEHGEADVEAHFPEGGGHIHEE
jgi:predicted  nucleic acid-binding Zn-ribbon protein